jgi:hypothetical protein
MKVFIGIVTAGYGVAARNLDPVMALIESRTGLANLVRGTLNVNISDEYIVRADALINPDELFALILAYVLQHSGRTAPCTISVCRAWVRARSREERSTPVFLR